MAYQVERHDPISIKEFKKAFLALWKAGGGKHAFMRLGFAISGGVDSMALAYLWNQLRLNQSSYNPFVQGFVIDHGLRPGSAEEARVVASRLEPLLGMPGQIITLDWSRYGSVKNVTSIETIARQLRFQALGRAAHSCDIQCILMGHHADDIAETALFRLAKGSQGTGLLGVRPIANIPECDGLFGIHGSGSFRRLPSHEKQCHYIGGPENGGIKVGRPLLEFPKSRLITTCESAGIKWAEDNTNGDVRLTQRNAIRAMTKSGVFPMALQSASIQNLIKNIKDTDEIRKDLTEKLYAATKIDSFDLRSGVICLHLPSRNIVAGLLGQYPDQDIVFEALSALLHSFVECVSSADVKLEVVKLVSTILYKELATGLCDQPERPLSVGQVIIERIRPLVLDNRIHIGLRLHRAPFVYSSSSYRDFSQDIILPPMRHSSVEDLLSGPVNPEDFHLWDGRWWMRIQNYSSVHLRIEPLDQKKMHAFRNTMNGYHWSSYAKLFSEASPGSSRWTIPAIICDGIPPAESMIPPNARFRPKHVEQDKSFASPSFENLKYDAGEDVSYPKLISRGITSSSSKKISTSILSSLELSVSCPKDSLSEQLSKSPRLIPIPLILQGTVDADKYPKPNGPFIVAIPTMGIFLNAYWASKLVYDIRYRAVPLTDMHYISSYRMEKPAKVDIG